MLVKGGAVNLTDAIHSFPGHNLDPDEMMQTMQILTHMLLNQTTEIEQLKQQTEKHIYNTNVIEQSVLSGRGTKRTIQTSFFPGIFHVFKCYEQFNTKFDRKGGYS